MARTNKKLIFAPWAANNQFWFSYQLLNGPIKEFFSNIVTFDPQEEMFKHGKKEMNRRFLNLISQEKPNYLFLWIMLDEFDLETLAAIKKISPRTKVMSYNGDDDYKFYNHTLPLSPFIDYYLITQPQYLDAYKKCGKQAFFVCGSDTKEFKPLPVKKEYDVTFVGSPKRDRMEYLSHLINNGINVRIYGSGWDVFPEFAKHYAGRLPHEEFSKAINESRINICLSKNYVGGTHILERFFEINSCKSFCLTEFAEGYFPIFSEGKDIVTFKNKEELLKKTKYYLEHPKERESIANAAYKKTIKGFSTKELFTKAFKQIEKSDPLPYSPAKISELLYLDCHDLKKGRKLLQRYLEGCKYVGFKDPRYTPLPMREEIQLYVMKATKKKISCCDAYLSSSYIGDYAYVALYYAFDVDKNKICKNLDLPQLIVEKEYLLEHLDKFLSLANEGNSSFINKENTSFISLPLIRTKIRKSIPIRNVEHVFFPNFENELLLLKNKKRVAKDPFVYRLAIYSLLVNPKLLRYILTNTLKRTKNARLISISSFFDNLFA